MLLRYDGSKVAVEDVQDGDQLLGPDGGPRRVFNKVSGSERLYRIVVANREDLVVTANHILVLRRLRVDDNKYDQIEMTASDFASLEPAEQANHRLFRCPGFEYDEQDVPVDPYFLGLWLGDGDHKRANIYNSDEADDKCIPTIYLNKSRAVRMALLAGIIDTNGRYYMNQDGTGSLRFVQSEKWHPALFQEVVTLARSLGFQVSVTRPVQPPHMFGGRMLPASTILEATIHGNVAEFPSLLARKQPMGRLRTEFENYAIHSITLEDQPTDWSGFRVDKDHLYLRHDYIVLHNSGKFSILSKPYYLLEYKSSNILCRLRGVHEVQETHQCPTIWFEPDSQPSLHTVVVANCR